MLIIEIVGFNNPESVREKIETLIHANQCLAEEGMSVATFPGSTGEGFDAKRKPYVRVQSTATIHRDEIALMIHKNLGYKVAWMHLDAAFEA